MAENAVLRKFASDCLFKRVDIINALPDEGPFLEKVLVDVGNRSRIRIDTRVPGKQPANRERLAPGRLTATRGWRML
jgi:hypothetical protein